MIQKIKELMELNDKIVKISKDIDKNNEKLDSFSLKFDKFEKRLQEIEGEQQQFLDGFKQNLEVIKGIKDELKSEVYDFKLIKSDVKNKLVEKFEEELKNELKLNLESLKHELNNYNEIKSNVNLLLQKTKAAAIEIDKFSEIGKNIKKEDFMLSRFADELRLADKEKLELLHKIDALERLISKMRRRNV